MNDQLAPRWYLRAETPVGVRYFYPKPKDQAPYHPEGHHWTDESGEPLEVRGTALVSDHPVTEAVETWDTPARASHWMRRQDADIPAHLRPLISTPAYPTALSADGWAERTEDDDAADVLRQIYTPVMSSPGTDSHRHSLAGLTELPGDPDPAPDLTWDLAEQAVTAFYGPLVAHLFPGRLGVPFERVAASVEAAVKGTGLPGGALTGTSMYAFEHDRKISVHLSIPWDRPLPYDEVPGRSRKAREANAAKQRASRMAMSWSAEVKVPRWLTAPDKTTAVAALETYLADVLDRLLPPHVEACSHCHGLRYTR